MEESRQKLERINRSPSLEKRTDGKPVEVTLKTHVNPLSYKPVDRIYFQNVKRQLHTTKGSIASMQKKSLQDRLHLERVAHEMQESLSSSNLKLEKRAAQIQAQRQLMAELQDNVPRREQDQRAEEHRVEDMVSNINLQDSLQELDQEAQEVIANLAAIDGELSSFGDQKSLSRQKDSSLKDAKEKFTLVDDVEEPHQQEEEEEILEGGHGAQPMGRLQPAPKIVYVQESAVRTQELELNAQTSHQVSSSSYEVITKQSF